MTSPLRIHTRLQTLTKHNFCSPLCCHFLYFEKFQEPKNWTPSTSVRMLGFNPWRLVFCFSEPGPWSVAGRKGVAPFQPEEGMSFAVHEHWKGPSPGLKPKGPAADPEITGPRCCGRVGVKINHINWDKGWRFCWHNPSKDASTSSKEASQTLAGKLRTRNLCALALPNPELLGVAQPRAAAGCQGNAWEDGCGAFVGYRQRRG